MLSRFIAISLLATVSVTVAYAGSIETPAAPEHIRSIDYVGYDGIDAAGNPICNACEAEKAAKAAKMAALEARRKRARDYMARMQGQEPASAVGGAPADVVKVDTMPVGALPDEALEKMELRAGQ
ncbi:hypothetical protein ATN84_00975 [Paramesorhizobium deserti]|uniref:Uncharacterized protein n=1 Tax=Paramesorhizobium deserti TaxID=1494590 RepID=A0A135HYY7_9HYPH|nr:hypothetical protein [Paramesorhizobium deserti]KXF78407.1 hypothetical protein ATN84_00975 [Paramesorhizobium deserti]